MGESENGIKRGKLKRATENGTGNEVNGEKELKTEAEEVMRCDKLTCGVSD